MATRKPTDLTARVESLCRQGLYLTAYREGAALGPFERWPGIRGQILGARLMHHLGATRKSRRAIVRTFRKNAADAFARYWYAAIVLRERGPLPAWHLLNETAEPEDAELRADLQGERVRVLAVLRDIDRARELLAAIDPECIGRGEHLALASLICQRADAHEEALELIRRALSVDPSSRAAIHQAVALFELLDRRAEALQLLEEHEPRLESAWLTLERASILHEAGRYDDEARCLGRYESLTPLREAHLDAMLQGRRSDNAYERGDVGAAIAHARKAKAPFFERLAERLTAPEGHRRRRLDVPMIVQHDMTCAPATLTMLSAYFKEPVDHVDVADQICYEGTAGHSERRWVEERGWVSREFTLDWPTAVALLERGIPFAVVTVQVGSAHMQAAIGFDEARKTLFFRDPNTSILLEADVERFLEHLAPYGPRAHALVPPHRAALLDGILFPETELHDRLYRLSAALEAHDRDAAVASLRVLEEGHPDHRLTWWARRELASYDRNVLEVQHCSEALLRLFPKEPNALLSVLSCMSETATSRQRVERLERAVKEMGASLFQERLADALLGDARELRRAIQLIHRALRGNPTSASSFALLGRALWLEQRRTDAVELFRFASCIEPTNEDHAQSYFKAAHWTGQLDEGLSYLERRFQRLRARSGLPGIGLFQALERIDRVDDAFRRLEELVEARPDDGNMLLFAAEAHSRYGRRGRATELLDAAHGKAAHNRWLRTAAAIADQRGQLAEALARWRQVAESEPLAVDAHRAVAELIGELEGSDAARNHLAGVAERHPHNIALGEIWVGWLRGHEPSSVERAIRRLLEAAPDNAWARRELALHLAESGNVEAALGECEQARRIEPFHPAHRMVLAVVLERAARYDEARSALREALELEPDLPSTISTLVYLTPVASERLDELRRIAPGLFQGSVNGHGVLAWYSAASRLFSAEELDERLGELQRKRPQLWASHHVYIQHLLSLGRNDAAREALDEALRRFSHQPALFGDRADLCAVLGDGEGEIAAVRRRLELDAGDVEATLRLATACARQGDVPGSRAALERGLEYHPRCAPILERLAEIAWNEGDRDRALAALEQAIAVDPSSAQTWNLLCAWYAELERLERAPELARRLSRERPWNARLWLCLGETLLKQRQYEAALEALDAALGRDPTLVEAADLRPVALAELGRKDEALDVCKNHGLSGRAAAALEARGAWVLARCGDREGAIEMMKKVVEHHPDHLWAWQQLADWCQEAERFDDALAAARQLTRLAPHEGTSHGFLGDALRAAGEAEDALASFERAVQLAPQYRFAVEQVLDLALARRNFAAVERAIDLAGPHYPDDVRRLWKLRLALRRDDWPAAEEATRALVMNPDASGATLDHAGTAWAASDVKRWRKLVDGWVFDRRANPEVGAAWVRAFVASGKRPRAARIQTLASRHPRAAVAAVREYFDWLGSSAARYRTLITFARLGPIARHDDLAWGKVGFALAACGWHFIGARWMRDYRQRPTAQAWMLHNLRVCRLEALQPTGAFEVARDALALPTDETTLAHLVFAALGLVIENRTDEADALLRGLSDESRLSARDQWLGKMTRALVALERAPAHERSRARNAAWTLLTEHVPKSQAVIIWGDGSLGRSIARAIHARAPSLRSWCRVHAFALLGGGLVVAVLLVPLFALFGALWLLAINAGAFWRR